MSSLVVSYTVSRAAPLATLQLENVGSYRVVAAGPGSVVWRRQTTTGPFTHGEVLIGATKEQSIAPLSVRVYGTSHNDLDTKTAALLAAFEQFSYTVNCTINGVVHSWACQPADYGPSDDSGLYDPHYLRSLQQVYGFRIPRSPVPILGSM